MNLAAQQVLATLKATEDNEENSGLVHKVDFILFFFFN
jgi:hypothetical protein